MAQSFAGLPVFSEALQGVESAVSAANGNLLLASIPDADRVPVFLARNLVDGLIVRTPLIGDFRSSTHPEVLAAIENLPHVWLVAQPDHATGDVVESDHDRAGHIAAEYLATRGHRHIGYIRPHPGKRNALEAREMLTIHSRGSGRTVRYFGVPDSKPVRWPVPVLERPDPIHPLLEEWEAIPKPERPTALAVGADVIAVQLYAALQERGYRVGRDVSVFSFRREASLAARLQPTLTTLDIQAEAIGRRAVDHLWWRIHNPGDHRPTKIRLEPTLVEGGSVADLS